MNKITKYGPMLILIMLLLASTVILLKGCGGNQDAAELIGCPDGSLLANTGDKFRIVPADATVSAIVYSGSTYATVGGPVVPLTYQVSTNDDQPRNKICVKFYTNGSFWALDDWYGTSLPNPLAVETDMSGMATVYWSTAPLLVSNPATTAPAPGTDHGPYTSFINAYSGPVLDLFTYDVTISGCPENTIGSCP